MFFGVTEGILGGIALSYCLTWGFGVVEEVEEEDDEDEDATPNPLLLARRRL